MIEFIEPHEKLLKQPSDTQLLYKIMSVENLIASISDISLYFNRIDSYKDFPGADAHDGRQLPKDQPGNTNSKFLRAPNFSAADSYDLSRKRTYACCLSLLNSDYIWKEYGNGGNKGKVCLVFEFGKLRKMLNETFENSTIKYGEFSLNQIFFINYGTIEYVKWNKHQENQIHLPNPIRYSYLKDNKYNKEKELRITLSALGVGKFTLNGNEINFPEYLQVDFDFKAAIDSGAIQQILYDPSCRAKFLLTELRKRNIYKVNI